VESFDSKQYNTDIGKCILQLQSLDLPCDKMGQIIQTVSENIKVDGSIKAWGSSRYGGTGAPDGSGYGQQRHMRLNKS
jgi:hypothetical protein